MDKYFGIIGSGGFGRETLANLAQTYKLSGSELKLKCKFIVDDEYFNSKEVSGIEVIRMSQIHLTDFKLFVSIGDPAIRKKIVKRLGVEAIYGSVIHYTSIVPESLNFGEGLIIAPGCILTCDLSIGKHVQLNLQTTVGHDTTIGDWVTTAPGVRISGNCNIGEEVYLGTNVSIRDGITICSKAIIGMGAVVVKNILEPGVYVGNPAVRIK
ncbi:MAG: NeuD/PglB/VioB family sugar acetyltransferase [Bacteroidetes bacterium]|nr:NeuD/PglB/VioB family sugar acetyltransferase [Bacteroidota bacterium]